MRELCKKYTNLTDEDIQELEYYDNKMEAFSELLGTDLFIDCLISGTDNAVVVSHKRPSGGVSLFPESVVGVIVGKETEPAVIRTLITGLKSKDIKGFTMEKKTVYETVIPIKNKSGDVIGALVNECDVTKEFHQDYQIKMLEKEQEKLLQNLQHLQENPKYITQHMKESIIIFDSNRKAIDVNPEARSLYKKLGYIEDIEGMYMENLILSKEAYIKLQEGIQEYEHELTFTELTLNIRYININIEGSHFIFMLIRNISEIRNKEKELILKSVAVKEIHHRVKNNLQTISSILTMQARRAKNEEIKHILQENTARIQSIAKTHEVLAGQGLDKIELRWLLEEISGSIIDFAKANGKDIKIKIFGDDILISSDIGSSIALVINELFSNSIKHGFKERDSGEIELIIFKGNIFATFTIRDNGIGYKETESRDSLGLGIVNALVKEKLRGNISISSNKYGTSTEFNVKIV